MRKILDFLPDVEFLLKVAISCTCVQQIFYYYLRSREVDFAAQVILYWMVNSASFYGIGFFIEKYLKRNNLWKTKFTARVTQVKEQPFPEFTTRGVFFGELKSLATAAVILYIAPEVHRGNSLLFNFLWFFMQIIIADFCFYLSHRLLHSKPLLKIHLRHHEFQDSSSFVAGHKSFLEFIITTMTDLLPIFIFGYDITQLCAWNFVGNAYNLEGHSSLSIFFISSDFHDLHHTCFKGNYGIQGFWDRAFRTLNAPTQQQRLIFPTNYLNFQRPDSSDISPN
jgi:sterol desaturase/sphingolipid hydroxylase (fatty acid hydroxylase superfamily)